MLVALNLITALPSPAQDQNAALQEADNLQKSATIYFKNGDYANALPLFEHALAIREKALGSQHPDTAYALHNLAGIYCEIGDNTKALPLYERSLAICEKSFGAKHPYTAEALESLAILYWKIGDYAKAIPLAERALAICEKTLDPQHPAMVHALSNLAGLYSEIWDNAKALPLYERSLTISEKNFGPQHPNTAGALNGLAQLYRKMGNYAKALSLYERALAICEKALDPQHPDTAVALHTSAALNGLAGLYREVGDHAKSLLLYERSLAICEKSLGSQHPYTVAGLNNIAGLYSEMGNYSKALPFYERALAICEKTLGPQHPATGRALNNLAILYYELDDLANSINFSSRAVSSVQSQLKSILNMDERSRLSWQGKSLRFDVAPCVLPHAQVGQVILRWKGVVLDSLIEDRAVAAGLANDSDGTAMFSEIQQLRSRRAKLAFSETKSDLDAAEQIANRIADLERSLATRGAAPGRVRRSAAITLDDVLPSLSGGGVLLDFIQFLDPKLKDKEVPCYGALLLAEDGQPHFVRIDGAETIDHAISDLRKAVMEGNELLLAASGKVLAEKLWSPLAAKLPLGAKTLFIGPDGALNYLTFAALQDAEGRFISEKYEVVYVGSGRDLASPTPKDHNKQIALFANPVFDQRGMSSATNRLAMRSAELTEFGQIMLPQLPGTEVEGKSLVQEAEKQGWAATAYFGDKATEQQIRALKKPGILHLATHGFYLNAFASNDDNTRGMKLVGLDQNKPVQNNGKGVDPMRASGIALTGAQATLKAWSEGKAPDPESDGVLTAEEVAGLDLEGTWLATLSACETGVGEVKSGEGVFGLRRAFMMAGAQNLLMTLWPVSDSSTADFMKDFYHRALDTDDAPRALADTQRDWLVKLRKEKGLLAAVRDAGPFIMTTMGALPANATLSAPQKKSFVK